MHKFKQKLTPVIFPPSGK